MRSAADHRRHLPGVAWPGNFLGRQDAIERFHPCGVARNDGHFLLQIFSALSVKDRDNIIALVEQPGKRDLPGFRIEVFGDVARRPHSLHFGVVVLTLAA